MHNVVYFVNFYMFRAYLGPSSGGTTVCIQQLVLIILFRWLSVVLVGLEQSNQDNRQSSKKNYFVNVYMFRAHQSPSSGGTTVCIQQLVLIILFRWLPVVLVGLFQSNQDNGQSSKKNYFVNAYMFQAHQSPSSGGTTVCMQQLVLIILFRWLPVVLVGLEQSNQDNRQ